MSQANQALKVALAAAEQLPAAQQRQLAEQLLSAVTPEGETLVLHFQRLSAPKQERLQELMDGNNEGTLTRAEQAELKRLVAEADEMMLANSKALARAMRPELFDEKGRPIKRRFQQALGTPTPSTPRPPRKNKGR